MYLNWRSQLIVYSLLIGFNIASPVYAQEIISFNTTSEILPIGRQVYFLEDKQGNLTLQDILTDSAQHAFKLSADKIPNYANTTSAIWCRFAVVNATRYPCMLRIEKSLIHQIDFYRPSEDGYVRVTTGALYPANTREIRSNFFLFELFPEEVSSPAVFYIRFKSEESLEIPLSLATPYTLFTEHRRSEVIFGIFFGIMIVMLIYNLFIYVTVREKAYLYYVIYILTVLLLNDMMVSGLAFEYLWPETPRINFYINALTGVVCVFMILFSAHFLNTRLYTPRLHKGFYFFYGLSAFVIITNLLGNYFISSIACQAEAFLLSIYLIIVGAAAWNRGLHIARFYLLAWSFLLLSAIIYILFMNGILPSNKLTENITLIGSALEVTLLSLALVDRINILQKDKEKAQQEKLEVIREQNITLEKLVTERTHEIITQNEEIASQNEELITQQDQIQSQNEELQSRNEAVEEARKIIESKNRELKEYSENLEREVAKRAFDLMKTNKELVQQNHQLEQFAFIAAHNLRAPVARIQGLANILNYTDLGPERAENQDILKKIVETSEELDRVISDLSLILQVKKGTVQGFEQVDLPERLSRVLSMLKEDIDKAGANVIQDLQVKQFYSLPQYIESILYNLISNAIKYRDPSRQAEIRVSTWSDNHYFHMLVKDNGIGFDLNKYEDKVFGLYQRFHTHVEGKGLGLHLVKTQVDALGAKISVASEPRKGTTFEIIFQR